MFSQIHGWTDVQRSPGTKLRLGLGPALSFVAGALCTAIMVNWGLRFLLARLVGALGFKHAGYVPPVPLAVLLWLRSLRPLPDDLRQRAA